MTRDEWRAYLKERTGTYEYRTRRYAAVVDKLELLGLQHGDCILDLGAGMCEFGRYLYSTRGWSGQYWPVDGSISGDDLDVWCPDVSVDFVVAIELLEHLNYPFELVDKCKARKGYVFTTPNTNKLGELAVFHMDRTHVTPLYQKDFVRQGYKVETPCLFGEPEDSIIAYKKAPPPK